MVVFHVSTFILQLHGESFSGGFLFLWWDNRLEPIYMQPASGRLLTPVRKLAATSIFPVR